MNEVNSVLVATDFSESAQPAVDEQARGATAANLRAVIEKISSEGRPVLAVKPKGE